MAASNTASNRILRLLKKTTDIDSDERFMATSDICTELAHMEDVATAAAQARSSAGGPAAGGAQGSAASSAANAAVSLDPSVQQSLGRALLVLLEDSSSDVQTVSVKCLSVLCRRFLGGEQLLGVVDKLCALICDRSHEKDESRDIYAIGLKTMVAAVAGASGAGAASSVGAGAPGPASSPPPGAAGAATTMPSSIGISMANRIISGMLGGLAAEPALVAAGGVSAAKTTTSDKKDNTIDVTTTLLDIIREVLIRFGAQVEETHAALLNHIAPRLESPHESIRKRAISTLAVLVPVLSDAQFGPFMDTLIQQIGVHERAAASSAAGAGSRSGKGTGASSSSQDQSSLLYTYIQMIGVVSTTAGGRIGKYLPQIVPQLAKFLALPHASTGGIASPQTKVSSPAAAGGVGAELLIDLSEHALAAFESLILCCPREFAPFLPEILPRAKELMSFDPNYEYVDEADAAGAAADEDVDMGQTAGKASAGGGGNDEDEEAWGAGGDDSWGDDDENESGGGGGMVDDAPLEEDMDAEDDSTTWKVRRGAVKVVSAFIRSNATLGHATGSSSSAQQQQGNLLQSHYASLCDALLARFKERDPNVKNHVISTMEELLRESGEDRTGGAATGPSGTQGQGNGDESMCVSSSSAGLASPSSSSTSFHFHPGVRDILSSKVSSIVNASLKLLRKSDRSSSTAAIETKHRVFLLLQTLLHVRRTEGGLGEFLPRLVPLLLSTLASAHTAQVLKVDSVSLLRSCIESHPVGAWFGSGTSPIQEAPSTVASIATTLSQAMKDNSYIRLKTEIISTTGALLILLGNFKSSAASNHPLYSSVVTSALLDQIYSLLQSTLQLNDVDTSLKESVLAAVSWAFFFFGQEYGQGKLEQVMSTIARVRLSNELTRLASLRCVARIASAQESGLDLSVFLLGSLSSSAGAPQPILSELISFLKKDSPLLQIETAHTILAVMGNMSRLARSGSGRAPPAGRWTPDQVSPLVRESANHIGDQDLNLSTSLLELVSELFLLAPDTLVLTNTAQSVADADLLIQRVLLFLRSPLLQAQNIRTVRKLFHTIVQLQYPSSSSGQPAANFNPHLTFAFLYDALSRGVVATGASGTGSASSYLSHAASIVGSGLLLYIPREQQAPVLQKLVDTIKAPSPAPAAAPAAGAPAGTGVALLPPQSLDSSKQFSLLILGELGRHIYLAPLHPSLDEGIFLSVFSSPQSSEQLKTSASLAWGQVVLGNIPALLPVLLKHMETEGALARKGDQTAQGKVQLMLSAVRELIHHVNSGEHPVSSSAGAASGSSAPDRPSPPQESFRTFIPSLLPLLWLHAEDSEESVRSLVSEVLGGVIIIDSRGAIGEMVRLVSSPSAAVRGVVITALRHALTQQAQHSSALSSAQVQHAHAPHLDLSPFQTHLPAFLSLLRDADLSVRRQAILTVNALAHAREGHTLLAPHFEKEILPTLYAHLQQDPKLVRVVDLGPFKHKIDDGFPLRKAAFQTLSTLLDAGFSLLDLASSIRALAAGFADHDDISVLVWQLLHRLATSRSGELAGVLDELPQKMMDNIKEKLKASKAAAASTEAAAAASASGAAGAAGGGGGDASSGERARDVLRTAMRCMLALAAMPTVTQCPGFVELYQRVLKTALLARIIEEIQQEH